MTKCIKQECVKTSRGNDWHTLPSNSNKFDESKYLSLPILNDNEKTEYMSTYLDGANFHIGSDYTINEPGALDLFPDDKKEPEYVKIFADGINWQAMIAEHLDSDDVSKSRHEKISSSGDKDIVSSEQVESDGIEGPGQVSDHLTEAAEGHDCRIEVRVYDFTQ